MGCWGKVEGVLSAARPGVVAVTGRFEGRQLFVKSAEAHEPINVGGGPQPFLNIDAGL
jgi:hypothetical protein